MRLAKEQLEVVKRGTVQIVEEEELLKKFDSSLRTQKPLRVKLGVDPTAPDIHLGHTVVLEKLRQFQELGHHPILILGDFTALVGDPSGRDKVRPPLSREDIESNAQTYLDQIGKILDTTHLEVVRNSAWLSPLTLQELLKLTSLVTVAQILTRDHFWNRYEKGVPIFLHEFLYPLMQAYDSVAVRADVELGGTDQTFNLLLGREIQQAFQQSPQIAITVPILEGLDGKMKMSKSFGNYVGLHENARTMFGKLMSLPDALMEKYFTLLTRISQEEVQRLVSADQTHPREAKVRLAKEIVAKYHTPEVAQEAYEQFEKVFVKKEVPEDIPEFSLSDEEGRGTVSLAYVLQKIKYAPSLTEARRLIQQGAVWVNDQKVTDINEELSRTQKYLLRVGKKKRFARIRFHP